MVRRGRPRSRLTRIRKRLRKAQRSSKSKFIRQEAGFARSFINEATALRRFTSKKVFSKPLLDDPSQLKKRRIRQFAIVGPMGVIANIN